MTNAIVMLDDISEYYAESFSKVVVNWLREHEDKLPIAQSNLASQSSHFIRKNAKELGSDRWIKLLRCWNRKGLIRLEKGAKRGFVVDLPAPKISQNKRRTTLADWL